MVKHFKVSKYKSKIIKRLAKKYPYFDVSQYYKPTLLPYPVMVRPNKDWVYHLHPEGYIYAEDNKKEKIVVLDKKGVDALRLVIKLADALFSKEALADRGIIKDITTRELSNFKKRLLVFTYLNTIVCNEYFIRHIYNTYKLLGRTIGLKIIRGLLKSLGFYRKKQSYVNTRLKILQLADNLAQLKEKMYYNIRILDELFYNKEKKIYEVFILSEVHKPSKKGFKKMKLKSNTINSDPIVHLNIARSSQQ